MSIFEQYIETVNPFLIPKNEKEYKKFANKSKLPNIQNYLKSNQIIPTGGPEEVKEPTSRQAKDKFEAIKNSIINSSWFKQLIKRNKMILVNEYKSKPMENVEISVKNETHFYSINLQNGSIYKKPLDGVWTPANPIITFPFKQIYKNLTIESFKDYLQNDFFPNI